jgi:hypothetical protein
VTIRIRRLLESGAQIPATAVAKTHRGIRTVIPKLPFPGRTGIHRRVVASRDARGEVARAAAEREIYKHLLLINLFAHAPGVAIGLREARAHVRELREDPSWQAVAGLLVAAGYSGMYLAVALNQLDIALTVARDHRERKNEPDDLPVKERPIRKSTFASDLVLSLLFVAPLLVAESKRGAREMVRRDRASNDKPPHPSKAP